MITQFKKAILATALTATALTAATPAMAQHYNGHRRGGGDTAGAAILGGIIGIALGAAIASSGKKKHRHHDGYRDGDGYYRDSGYDRGGYHRGHRHGRDEDCDERDGWRGGYNDRDGYYERRGYRDGYGNYRGY